MQNPQQILKSNGQNPNQAFQSGKLKFDKTASCLVYNPPGVNNFKEEITKDKNNDSFSNKSRC